jgi:hypothetical protein
MCRPGLEKVDIVVDIDLLPDPVRHFREQIPHAHVALERRGHLDDVKVDDSGFDRMLHVGEIFRIQIDPLQLCPRVGLPRLQEGAKHEVVKILKFHTQERQLDAVELTRLHVGFGGPEAELADLLPVQVGRGSVAGPRDLHNLGDHAVGGMSGARCERQGTARRQRGSGAPGAFQHRAPVGLHRHDALVDA